MVQDSSAAADTKIVRRQSKAAQHVSVDICVVGAGISGVSAALEAARLGRRVAIVDGLPMKRYGTAESPAFVNGVLDHIARQLAAQGPVSGSE